MDRWLHGLLFYGSDALFGYIRLAHGLMFEDDGHTHGEKKSTRECNKAASLHLGYKIWQKFALPTMATKSTRSRQGGRAERILHQQGPQKGVQAKQVTSTDVSFTNEILMFPCFS